ncbi:uncharacterized protein LOC105784315 [Gossypium raimondii]|uniref:uncharacterized protein LOC105784315 n=1 Tax=Gossypium raimondii TaxID=29730 RepID=UPI00227C24C9|nr:uncharacterized protein LOC105784315 [Gossypium raimondii]
MVSDARKKKAAQKKADNGVDNVSDGDSALQISDRTCTSDLCSHPVSRDIRIESLPVTFHGHDLIVDSIQIAPPPAIPNQASNRTDLARIADSLEDVYHIGFTRHRPPCHPATDATPSYDQTSSLTGCVSYTSTTFELPTAASRAPLKHLMCQLKLPKAPLSYSVQ